MSENYIVSARKYRPTTFSSVVGQSSLTTTLKNSIASGRLAHAYLFCGPRGVGKTTCARIFAKTINCFNPKENGDACEECESCRAFNEQRSYNIHELDAASNNSVDDIRQLIEQVNIPPQVGKYKVFIVDEVHMLSTAAFNAFLKTLEEPPKHAIFILATTEKHKLLPTILSRCQIYDFSRMTVQDIVGHLERVAQQEGITYEPAALNVIAQKADGGMRDALSIFDQVASFCQGNITYQQTITDLNVLDYEYYFKLVDFFLTGNVSEIMLTLNDILSKGFEGSHFVGGLNTHFRNLLISRDEATTKLLEVSDDIRQRYAEQAKRCTPKFLYAAIRKCTDCDLNYKVSQNKRLLVELTLIEISQIATGEADGNPSGLGPTKILKPIFTKQSEKAPASTPANLAASTLSTPKEPIIVKEPIHPKESTNPKESANPKDSIPSTPPATPAPGSFKTVRSFSIKQRLQSQTQGTATTQAATPTLQTQPKMQKLPGGVTEENIITAWHILEEETFKDEPSIGIVMRNHTPHLLDEKTFEVAVSNAMNIDTLKKYEAIILSYIRDSVGSDALTMTIRTLTPAERPKFYTKPQRLQILKERYSALDKLCKELDLDVTLG
ncbi:MAG: DNA polymerase III subunit gamma/tau [Bacteroidaceae bacterium]|nr:DNA polymerase III subunit gamma/tau [Bacteroidaceae bacterium]